MAGAHVAPAASRPAAAHMPARRGRRSWFRRKERRAAACGRAADWVGSCLVQCAVVGRGDWSGTGVHASWEVAGDDGPPGHAAAGWGEQQLPAALAVASGRQQQAGGGGRGVGQLRPLAVAQSGHGGQSLRPKGRDACRRTQGVTTRRVRAPLSQGRAPR